MGAKHIAIGIFALPFILLFSFLFLAFFLLYLLTLVGPLYHCYRLKQEEEHQRIDTLLSRHPDMAVFPTQRGDIVYRWTGKKGRGDVDVPDESSNESESLLEHEHRHTPSSSSSSSSHSLPPVVLPGGLGSTLATTSLLHDALSHAGYDVLSFDRIGVGYSSIPASGEGIPMSAHIEDMHRLMSHLRPNASWIIVGGSFGSAVGQLYTAIHPESVTGFVNLDGLPYPLYELEGTRDAFRSFGTIYKFEAFLSSLGLFRFALWMVSRHIDLDSIFRDTPFSSTEIYAQIQNSNLLRTIAREMPLMEECSDMCVEQWGDMDLFLLPSALLDRLKIAPADVTITESQAVTADEDEREVLQEIREAIHEIPTCSPIALRWRDIPVRSISCRDYSYDPMEVIMKPAMKELYVAEHAFLSLYSKNGVRKVFPNMTHLGVLRLNDHVVTAVDEISNFLTSEEA